MTRRPCCHDDDPVTSRDKPGFMGDPHSKNNRHRPAPIPSAGVLILRLLHRARTRTHIHMYIQRSHVRCMSNSAVFSPRASPVPTRFSPLPAAILFLVSPTTTLFAIETRGCLPRAPFSRLNRTRLYDETGRLRIIRSVYIYFSIYIHGECLCLSINEL